MMTCKNCGAQIADNAAFCNMCGAPVAAPVPPMQQPEVSAVPEQPVQPEVNTAPVQPEMNVASGQFTQPMNDGMQFQNAQQMNTGAQFQNGQQMNGGMQFQNGQQMNTEAQFQNGQQMNGGAQFQNGYQMNTGAQFQNGYQMNNGMPYQNNQAGYNPYAYQNAVPAKNKKIGLIIGIIVAAIVIVAAILIVKLCFGGRNSYEDAVKQYVKGVQEHDLSMMSETFPKPLREEWIEDTLYWYDDEADLWEYFDQNTEYYCGPNVKYSYEIEEAERMDRDDLDELEEDLEYDYDYRCEITDAYELGVRIKMKGKEGEDYSYLDFIAVKIKGEWYLIED